MELTVTINGLDVTLTIDYVMEEITEDSGRRVWLPAWWKVTHIDNKAVADRSEAYRLEQYLSAEVVEEMIMEWEA